jgi:hypothetical protein
LRESKNWFVTTKTIYEANKAKGLLDDLDMDYEEEFVGDENEL